MEEREDEEELVVAAQAGNLAAFDLLARRYRPALIALTASRLGREEAQDAAQDALLIAFKALPTLDEPSRFRPWLAAIAKRRATRIRERRRETTTLDEIIVAYAPSIVEDLSQAGSAERLRRAIQSLPADQAIVMDLVAVEDWAPTDVAEFLELPLSTVKWRLHAARTALRQRFGYEGEDCYGTQR